MALEAAEEGRENRPMTAFGERIFSPGLKERLWVDFGDPNIRERGVFEGASRSLMLSGGTGMLGRLKFG